MIGLSGEDENVCVTPVSQTQGSALTARDKSVYIKPFDQRSYIILNISYVYDDLAKVICDMNRHNIFKVKNSVFYQGSRRHRIKLYLSSIG